MSTAQRVSPEIDNETDLRNALAEIRGDVARASSRDELTRLYRHAEALIALTYTPAWQKKFGAQVDALRRLADDEFATTARKINQRAMQIGTEAHYDETWGSRR